MPLAIQRPPSEVLEEVFISTPENVVSTSRALKVQRIRRLARGLYTTNVTDPIETVVKRHAWRIAGLLFPGAVVTDRTGIENRPSTDGSFFLASSSDRTVRLPGLVIRARKGIGPLEGDMPYPGGVFLASPERAYLENLLPSRRRQGIARRVSRSELERCLEDDLRTRGSEWLNRLRDRARVIAPKLNLQDSYDTLSAIIGALLGTRDIRLGDPTARARARGAPCDPGRLELFAVLARELHGSSAPVRIDPDKLEEWENLAFFEAYFSNFIEGTEFSVDEAEAIVMRGEIPRERPEDAHDVLGTFQVVANRQEMRRIPSNPERLVDLLRARHGSIMQARTDKAPGRFKTKANRAGTTRFVVPELVEGTLREGFTLYEGLRSPFHRAVFMTFLISEVHPFADGNGRVARIMMNAELVAAGERRILIPTSYRADYLSALKALSLNRNPVPIVRVLDFAQRYTAAIDFSIYRGALETLRSTNAFSDTVEANDLGLRLRLP